MYPDCAFAEELKAKVETVARRHGIVGGGVRGLIGLGIAAIVRAGGLSPLGMVGMGIAAIVAARQQHFLPPAVLKNM